MCMGHYEMKHPYIQEIYKEKKCLHIHGMIGNELVDIYTKFFILM